MTGLQCDKFHKVHTEIYEWFNIGFDKWGRTPTPEQTEIAQDIFLKLHKNKFLDEQTSGKVLRPPEVSSLSMPDSTTIL
jgi:methionyl-tRNA synthetase